MDRKPLHEDVPLAHAWVTGRRIYVQTPKNSTLNQQLVELGAKWDWEVRARWVGTGKRDRVLPLVLADAEREQAEKQAAAEVLAAGRWVQLPRDVDGVVTAMHQRAGRLGAVWDADGQRYALPSDDARDRLQRQLDTWLAEQQADRDRTEAQRRERRRAQAEQIEREQAEVRQVEADRVQRRRDRVVADSGRPATGETVTVRRYDERYMNRAGAEQIAWQIGSVRRLRDGRRGLVVDRHIRFWSEDDATEYSHEVQLPDNAHWAFTYTLAVVEPTDDERQADALVAHSEPRNTDGGVS